MNSQLQAVVSGERWVVSGKTELRQTQGLIIFISPGCQLTSTQKKILLNYKHNSICSSLTLIDSFLLTRMPIISRAIITSTKVTSLTTYWSSLSIHHFCACILDAVSKFLCFVISKWNFGHGLEETIDLTIH